MPAKTKKQQALFGVARAIQKGKLPAGRAGKAAQKIARTVSAKKVGEFARRTVRKGRKG